MAGGHKPKRRNTGDSFYENDVSAEEAAKKEGARLSKEDEDHHGSERPETQEAQRQEAFVRVGGSK